MTTRDLYNLELTNTDAPTARAYDAYVKEFLSYGANLRLLFDAAETAQDAPLINAHAAALHLAFEAAEGWDAARPFLARMEQTKSAASERERLFCEAVNAWAAYDYVGALKFLDELTVRWPADLCAIKWGQYHAFNLGDIDALLRFGNRAHIAHENSAYAHGMIAFALEQANRLDEAEDEGMRAVEIAIDDAWAHHAVAHVYETQGRAKEGMRWLDHCSHTWDKKGVFIREHNWWHAALFRLAEHRYEDALEVFDQRLWGEWPEFPQEQIGAISMLWRFELRGIDVSDRWRPIVDQVRRRKHDHLYPFHDLHYAFALARAGDAGEAEDFIVEMTANAKSETWTKIAAPAAQSLAHYLNGHHNEAARAIKPLIGDLVHIGGSHAQRHVFIETLEYCQQTQAAARAN